MADYCSVRGFENILEGWGGGRNSPEPIYSKDIYCKKCKIKARKIKITPKCKSKYTDRGVLHVDYQDVTIQCPKCKKKGTFSENYIESDRSYHSNEERRAHGID